MGPFIAEILYKPWIYKGFFQFEIIINVLAMFSLHLNTYVMGLRPLYIYIFHYFSAGIDCRRQNLTSIVIRRQFLAAEDGPRTERVSPLPFKHAYICFNHD